MLISPELLNIHEGVSWEQEFGLDAQSLPQLLSPIAESVMGLLKSKSAYVCLFEDKVMIDMWVGEPLCETDELQKLRDDALLSNTVKLIEDSHNNEHFAAIKKTSKGLVLGSCLLVSIYDAEQGIHGYACFISEQKLAEVFDVDQLNACGSLMSQGIVAALVAKKYKRLNKARDEFNQLVANTNQHPIFAKDKGSRLVFANKAFVDLYPPEQRDHIIGYTTVEGYDKAQQALFLADDVEAFATGEKIVIEKIDFPNGEHKVLETTKRHFKNGAGDDFILGVAYDLTKQYTLIDLLKKKNRDLDQVANLLATDVRAPANAMVKLITWIQQDLVDINNPEVTENLQEIRERAFTLSKLLTAIHRYCFAGRDKHVYTSVSLTNIVSNVVSTVISQYSATQKTQPEIATNIDDVTLHLPSSPITEVLDLIIRNSVEHNDKDKITIDIACQQENKHYVLSISDNGPGVDAAVSARMFYLFESTKQQGDEVSGLGLAIAQKIVESYNGSICFEHNVSHGAKIVIKWPIQQ